MGAYCRAWADGNAVLSCPIPPDWLNLSQLQVLWVMVAQIRPTDVLARTGGEGFVLLVADSVTTPDGLPVHVSLGVAHALPPDERADTVVSRADVAFYTAKALGRNRVCLSEELELGV